MEAPYVCYTFVWQLGSLVMMNLSCVMPSNLNPLGVSFKALYRRVSLALHEVLPIYKVERFPFVAVFLVRVTVGSVSEEASPPSSIQTRLISKPKAPLISEAPTPDSTIPWLQKECRGVLRLWDGGHLPSLVRGFRSRHWACTMAVQVVSNN